MLTLLLTCLAAVQHGHFKLWKGTAVGTRLALIAKSLAVRQSRRRPARHGHRPRTGPCHRRKEGQKRSGPQCGANRGLAGPEISAATRAS